MYPGTRAIATLTCGSRLALLQAVSFASLTLDQRIDVDILGNALGRVEEGDVGLNLDVLSNQDLFLEWRSSSATSSCASSTKCAEQIFEVDVAKALSTTSAATTKASETTETATSEGISSSAGTGVEASILVKSGRAVGVVCFLLLGV